jgi:hypothetical protein
VTTFIGQAGSYRRHRSLARDACASARDDLLKLGEELHEREKRQYGSLHQISTALQHVNGACRSLEFAVQALDDED